MANFPYKQTNSGSLPIQSNLSVPPKQKFISPRLRLCTLSGTEEVGRNCTFIEYGNEIIVIDCGLSFPEQELYGIDYLIPNTSYLKEHKHKIKAIVITHGHLDHTGALPYVLPDLDFPPIYGGEFACELIKERLTEFKLDKKVKINGIKRGTIIRIGSNFKVTFIGVTHSIPHSFSVFVETPNGNVFFSGDFKIDTSPANEPETDYDMLRALRGKVDLALIESTNATSFGKSKTEEEIGLNLEKIIKGWKGRVVLASFASRVSRIYFSIQIAQRTGRKIFVSGKSLKAAIAIAQKLNYIKIPDDLIISQKSLLKYEDSQILFLSTGSQGEEYGSLTLISKAKHAYFKIKKGDLIIMSSSDIPGNEYEIQKMTDNLIRKGAEIITNDMEVVHASGHGMIGDIKLMYDLITPKTVMPIHGTLTMRYQNRKNFLRWNMPKDNVFLTEDGECWKKTANGFERDGLIPAKPILIDGLGVGDVGDVVIADRQQLAEYGMFCLIINLSANTFNIIGRIQFVSRGFVYMKASKPLLRELDQLTRDIHREWLKTLTPNHKLDTRELEEMIEKGLSRFIRKRIDRDPMILPVII